MKAAADSEKTVEFRDVSRSFGETRAVDSLTLSTRKGEIYGLIGPDGAGKTTTLRMLIGALLPDAGRIFVQDLDVREDADRARERIGYMPQLYGLYGDLTVEENIRFFGELHGVERSFLSRRINELLDFVKLSRFRGRRAQALSGGMYKKLAIACSIIHSPGILVLDEPTNGVDPVSRRDLWSLLFELAHSGVTILVSTPYMDEAERCHTVGLLFNGRLIREGKPVELIRSMKGRLFTVEGDSWPLVEEALRGMTELPEGLFAFYRTGESLMVILDGPGARAVRETGKAAVPRSVSPGESKAAARLEETLRDLSRHAGGGRIRLLEAEPVFEDIFMEYQSAGDPAKQGNGKGDDETTRGIPSVEHPTGGG